jgi:DNA-binding Lrp family transcriptional regulator
MRSVEDVANRLKKQAKRNAAGQAALEKLVLEAHAEGKSLREIGEAAGMTPEGVRKMIARLTREAAAQAVEATETECAEQ